MYTISIGIPTRNRPGLLRQALESCRHQSYNAFEIIVSDDSVDGASEAVTYTFAETNPSLNLTYIHNTPALGQAGNVNKLFHMAQGDFFVLLHDDDLLMESGLEQLVAAMERHALSTAVVYGKLLVITEGGLLLPNETDKLNRAYFRNSQLAGVQHNPLRAAILQQVPPDGYLIPTYVANSVRYKSDAVVGNACDADFMIRVARSGIDFCYVDEYVSAYRLSVESITTSGNLSSAYYRVLDQLGIEPGLRDHVDAAMTRVSVSALKECALSKRRSDAWKIYWSHWYPWKRRLTPRGVYHIIFILVLGPILRTLKQLRIQ